MDKTSHLEKLRRENAARWKALKELHEKCSAAASANHPTSNSTSAVLAVELEMIQSTNYTEENLNFPQEVVASYGGLRQTNAVLERDIARERDKLDETMQAITQHKEVYETLISMKSSSSHEPPTQDSINDHDECDNEWIRDELRYVSDQLAERQYKRRRLDNDEETKSDSRQRQRESAKWSLDRLVLELMNRYLTSSLDPYLLVSSLPTEQWKVDLLKQCSVVQVHPDNKDLVCLSNYKGAST